ncbi:Ig-like domain-containing protein [Clostridium pasteurianum]|uniref:Ig-like domain-containing protein n=1 Tax=Clostridium pasteurianum TaxID=1501 RepID=UPI002260B7A3|nr:Ig-like domain-containing protein [Clostridium pasteurianum]UZW14353.1 Ig-like domain-containing protein [Clostridium pasteurianum]
MDTLKNFFNVQLKRYGIPVTVDNNIVTGFFIEYNDNINSFDDKYICLPTGVISQGSIINALGEEWICISKPTNYNNVYDKAVVRDTNNTTKIIKDNNILEFPSIVTTKSMDITTGTMVFLDGKLNVTVQNNIDTKKIAINDRFIIMQMAWNVINVDTSDKGLIIFTMQSDSIGVNDNLELEIADYDTLVVYRVDILNDNATINMGSTGQVQAQLINTNDSSVVDGVTFTYISNNPDIATVDSNGVITPVSIGNGTITVTYNNISNTFNYTVEEVVTHNYTSTVTGDTTAKLSSVHTYTFNAFDNGNPISDIATWSLMNNDDTMTPTTYASIQSTTDNTCTIKITGDYIFGDGTKYIRVYASGQTVTENVYLKVKLTT